MNSKLKNAKNLYLEGIRDGNVRESVTKYTGERYTQHSTGVGDGVEGFTHFFEAFIKRNPLRQIEIVRSLVDGQYVFLHVYQSLNNGEAKWVTADIFDTDENDKIIEHWDVIQEYVEEKGTASGRTLVDGPTEIEDIEKTESNKAFIAKFLQDILIDKKIESITNFINPDRYDQHNPQIKDKIEGLFEFMKTGNTANYEKVHRIIGQGNFVVALSHAIKDGDWCFIDIFRLKEDKIIEH